jgi:nicotinate-nucleotide adenylyltransferase
MRIGVLGGSFHPPHVGHALVAGWLGWSDRVDEVWLIPAFEHAFGKALAPFDDRVRWCGALAAAVGPWIRVETIERELGGTSYTIRTLDALAARHPEHAFRLVVGADVLPETPRWRDWARIEAAYAPIVVGRVGFGAVPGAPVFPEVSSTAIRAALARGEDVSALVPAGVLAAIGASAPVRWA